MMMLKNLMKTFILSFRYFILDDDAHIVIMMMITDHREERGMYRRKLSGSLNHLSSCFSSHQNVNTTPNRTCISFFTFDSQIPFHGRTEQEIGMK